jgi:hypothetical protein
MIRYFLVIALIFSCVEIAYCQLPAISNEAKALQYVTAIYSKSLSQQAGIYSGFDYIGYPYPVKKGHPFFLSVEPQRGDIYYDGMQYKDIPLWYDLVKKEVVTQHYDNFSRISLHPAKVRDFSISGHHFIHIDETEAIRQGLEKGFYDRIYSGSSTVLVRRAKDMLISTDLDGIWVNFSTEQTRIFLRTGTEYTPLGSQKSVIKALGRYGKEIQAHLKETRIRFKKEREKAIVAMVAYYDQLSTKL